MIEECLIGIDPGATGALIVLNPEGEIVHCLDSPSDPVAMFHSLEDVVGQFGIKHAAIERVHCNGKNGSKANWNLSASYHIWLTALAALEVSTRTPTPQEWQKSLIRTTDGKDTKERSLMVARRLWPNQARAIFQRKKDHNRADAALIAFWLHRQMKGGE